MSTGMCLLSDVASPTWTNPHGKKPRNPWEPQEVAMNNFKHQWRETVRHQSSWGWIFSNRTSWSAKPAKTIVMVCPRYPWHRFVHCGFLVQGKLLFAGCESIVFTHSTSWAGCWTHSCLPTPSYLVFHCDIRSCRKSSPNTTAKRDELTQDFVGHSEKKKVPSVKLLEIN